MIQKKKSFCFVMPWHYLERGGGAEMQAWLIAMELVKLGYNVSYICKTETKTQQTILNGVNLETFKTKSKHPWAGFKQYKQLLTKHSPDVIVQRLSSPVTLAIAKYCRKNGASFVWMCSDDKAPSRRMHRNKVNQNSSIKGYKKIFAYWLATINDGLRNRGMKRVDFAFTQNSFQAKMLIQEFGLVSNRIKSGHPIPSENITVEEKLKEKIVLWIANLADRKQPEKFLELAKYLSETDLRFVMIGGKQNKQYIESLLAKAPKNLEYLGHLPYSDTLNWYNKACIFVNTSKEHTEGFPNTYIQAWHAGTPVATLNTDPDGIIQKSNLGIVESDINIMANKLKSILTEPSQYESLSHQVRKYSHAHFTPKKIVQEFLHTLFPVSDE
jgi:glycosyltransferase involved in cell wall biosynthesis